jgi:membrane-bound lytic murein transglycosylase F
MALAAAPLEGAFKGDLPALQKRGTLRILVPASTPRLQRRASPMSAERVLAERFALKLGLKPVFIELADHQLFSQLDEGQGDLVAASLTITKERAAQVLFSRPLRFVREQLVVKADEGGVKGPADLAGKTVTVRKASAHAATLKALQGELVQGEPEPGDDSYSLIQKVARGELFATVADSDLLADALTFEPGVKAAFDLADHDPIGWALRKDAKKLKAAADAFIVEAALTSFKDDKYSADFDQLKQRGVLRMLTRNTSTTYFLYRGEQLGFEYELMNDFAKEQGLRLEVVVPQTREALLEYLREGLGDVVAAGMTITPERTEHFAFSTPYQAVNELVVVSAKNAAIKSLADLKGHTITVRKSSSYFESLSALKDTYGFELAPASEELETEELLDAVGEGTLEATVADSPIFEVEASYNHKLRSLGPIGSPKPLGWMLRQDTPKLKAALDAFLKKNGSGSLLFNVLVNKYFKNAKQMSAAASSERSDVAGRISQWDELVKKYARAFEFDWRLVLAQMFQESRFDPHAKSWVGAQGLMQVMPGTAKDLNVADVTIPEQGVLAGVKLLARYAKLFDSPQIKEKDRLRFALAAYNCGPGHIYDAQRLALDLKLDPNKWFKNVEQAMLLLSKPSYASKSRYGYCRCTEPVNYVSEIQTRYDSYSSLVSLED